MPDPSAMWPLFALVLRTERLELRLPREGDLVELAALAADGIHSPDVMPFAVPWTDGSGIDRARSVLRRHWSRWSAWTPQEWTLEFAVLHEGRVIGTQGVAARDFAVVREVRTGSWLGERHQGRGFGTEMRSAVLHLAFDGLGAVAALSDAFEDNTASLRVSAKLGYQPDGTARLSRRGAPAVSRRLRLSRRAWQSRPRPEVEVQGLGPCLAWFGVPGAEPLGVDVLAGPPSQALAGAALSGAGGVPAPVLAGADAG
jgi:RimJ/RimL family protein N-acetyltransferase